ncbi:transcription factor WRKY19-like [Curcuma longa]|uniref:transcription factor WRKY19-like n=1 Tax=Curcuma longa TaxID=136217 RepID=UPI003D9E9204
MEASARAALLAELNQAMELVRQLQFNPRDLCNCKTLTPRIASSIHNSILMAESSEPFGTNAGHDRPPCSSVALRPRAETSRRRYVLRMHADSDLICRKSLRSWRCQVRLSSVAGGVKVPGDDDGFAWRKYGQKKILGAKYPRSYFRCAHRASHGCPAKKQVQRSDDDPSVYDVTYDDVHTCLEQPREEEQGGARGAMQHDQEQSAAALKPEGEEEFVGQISPSFEPAEEQFFCASPNNFGGFDGAESSLLPMEFDWEIDPDSIWAGVEWMQ